MMAAAIIKQAEVVNLLKVPAIFWHKSLIVVLSIILQNNPFLNLTLLIIEHSVKCRKPRQGIKRDWTYLKLWHRNSRLPMKSGNQGEGGGCARVLSMNTRLLVELQDITFWQQDHLP